MKTLNKRITKAQRISELYARLMALGLSYDESAELLRIERTLHNWAEQECGDGNDHASWAIERDETTGIPFRVVYPHTGQSYRTQIADREGGAIRRLERMFKRHRGLWWYQQTDPRGCALYVGETKDIPSGVLLDSCYSRGIAVTI